MTQKGVTPATATSAGSSQAGGKVTYKAQRISPAGEAAVARLLPTMSKHATTSAAARLLPPTCRLHLPNGPVPERVWCILHPPLSERCVEGLCEVSQEVLRILTARA
jgi:hypothetical protein